MTHPASAGGSLAQALVVVGSSPAGLRSVEAAARLRRYGRNILMQESGSHPLSIFVGQFRSPLVVILLAAAALTLAIGETNEGLIIAGIVLASSGLGFYQEFRASSAMRALRARLAVNAKVLRDGAEAIVPSTEVVPGDVVMLAAGSLVAADGVLIEARDLEVDEAVLTGESFPAAKAAPADDGALADDNRVHMGTSVRSGYGRAVILATGPRTQFGIIAGDVSRLEPETSFARGIRRFGVLMTQIMLVMVALVLPINVLRGLPLADSLLFSIALAVGLTPELLPAIVSVTLARGAQQLARAGVLVRRLVAIENLGAMDVLCTDKTGTLTEGLVRLARAVDVRGTESQRALILSLVNARLQTGMSSPLDEALGAAGAGTDTSSYVRLDEVPYDFERRRLSVLAEGPDGAILVCKGAVPSVLAVCTSLERDGKEAPLGQADRASEEQRFADWGAQGFRVLAIATRPMAGQRTCSQADEAGLTLVGYALFTDPPKAGVGELVAELGRRGVKLKVITGDSRHIGAHVAAEVGLPTGRLVTGEEIARLNDRALARRAAGASLFAEVTPDQKERIVSALRRSHRVVGYLGDGINDAPALRAADIGISVDSAVDAAKEAADVVLLRHDLKVLLAGIVLGRTAFANTVKYITITASANIGNMISMAAASLFLPFLPMLAKQILLNNLMSDLPMLTVSTDKVDAEVVERPGRWDFGGMLRAMVAFGLLSSLFDAMTFVVLLAVFSAGETLFQTGWFTLSLLTEIAVVAVMRTRKPFYASAPSRLLATVSVLVGGVALVVPYVPDLAAALSMTPLPAGVIGSLALLILAYVGATEVLKGIIWRRAGRRRRT